MDELIAALRKIAALDGQTLTNESFAYRTGAHFAFEHAAKIAREALEEYEAFYCDSDPRLKHHFLLEDPS